MDTTTQDSPGVEYLAKPTLTLTVEPDGSGGHIVSDDEFLVWGEGTDLLEALADYVSSLAEYRRLVIRGAETNRYDVVELGRLDRILGEAQEEGSDD